MSAMFSIGFVGVSTQTTLVRPGSIAAATASTSATWAVVWSSPHGDSTLSKSRKLPPYASLGTTMWSPGRQSARSSVSSAASPLAKANPCDPSSSAAMHPSRAVRVGLALREYS